jgi:SAM-dependent methyltransferase
MKQVLNGKYWDQRYKNAETGWDLGQCSPPIKAYIDQLTDKNISILIPGCGNAHEAEYLIASGFKNVTVIDVSPTLISALKLQFHQTTLQIELADFFEYSGAFDLILEQTFFCAIDPSIREDYVKKVFKLLKPKGKLVGLLFNKLFEKEGPPFGGTSQEYQKLFEQYFKFNTFSMAYNSVQPRSQTELFINFSKL